jgi:hypothetical protein
MAMVDEACLVLPKKFLITRLIAGQQASFLIKMMSTSHRHTVFKAM